MERHEDIVSIILKLDLDDIENTISQPYHQAGPGRPPRKPLGIFKALMVKQLRNIPSDIEFYRRLWNDETLMMIYDIVGDDLELTNKELKKLSPTIYGVGSNQLDLILE